MVEQEKIKQDPLSGTPSSEIVCSKCHRVLSKGEFYNRDIISKEITCIDCQDNRILVNSENFVAVDDK